MEVIIALAVSLSVLLILMRLNMPPKRDAVVIQIKDRKRNKKGHTRGPN